MTHLSRPFVLTSIISISSFVVGCNSFPDDSPANGATGGTDATGGSSTTAGSGGSSGSPAAGSGGSSGSPAAGSGGSSGSPAAGSGGNTTAGSGGAACPLDLLCDLGVPFVTHAFADTDVFQPGGPTPPDGATTATITNPEPGSLCLSGRAHDGWAQLVLGFGTIEDNLVVHGLDVQALGAVSMRFTLESPPPMGVGLELASSVPGCMLGDDGCIRYGYFLSNDPKTLGFLLTNQAGTKVAPFASFDRADWIDTSWQLDLTNLATLSVGTGMFSSATGDFDFCVKDFVFLDALGNVISG